MTIFARNPDTGMAKWVFQMTPHDEWDYDGVNEMILSDQEMNGTTRKLLVHFDRKRFRLHPGLATGELRRGKVRPQINWATHVDMKTGRPQVVAKYSPEKNGEDVNSTGICPAALGSKDQQPPLTRPARSCTTCRRTTSVWTMSPSKWPIRPANPMGSTVKMYAPPGEEHSGKLHRLGRHERQNRLVERREEFSVWSGVVATAGDVVFYGTLEGYLKAVDAKTGNELYKFKTPSGIIGNISTYSHKDKQYVAVLSGIGGWAGIGLAAGLTEPTAGLGAVNAYMALANYTALGGQLTVFALP